MFSMVLSLFFIYVWVGGSLSRKRIKKWDQYYWNIVYNNIRFRLLYCSDKKQVARLFLYVKSDEFAFLANRLFILCSSSVLGIEKPHDVRKHERREISALGGLNEFWVFSLSASWLQNCCFSFTEVKRRKRREKKSDKRSEWMMFIKVIRWGVQIEVAFKLE